MLIRANHMEAFRRASAASYLEQLADHCTGFSPRLCGLLGRTQLRIAIGTSVERARSYGLLDQGAVRLFAELSFVFGSSFDSDPQYPWALKILRAKDPQMVRAQQLYEKTLDYLERVSGPNAENTHRALSRLQDLTTQPQAEVRPDYETAFLRLTREVFPEKALFVGEIALRQLMQEGRDQARRFRLPRVSGEGLLTILMFAFGHGCTEDPLYPWISRTLHDDLIVDGAGRAARLEQKSRVWLQHVVARNEAQTHER